MPLTTIDRSAALVAIDLQNGIAGIPTEPHLPAEVVARTGRLADAFRATFRPVVLVRVTLGVPAPGRTEVGSRGGGGARPPGWDEIVPELAGNDQDIVVTKQSWGAFHGTDLDLQLRRRGITQIVLTGIATSAGVESTARAAHEHGYHVTTVTDAMADRDEHMHRHAIERIFPRIGETGTTDEVLELL
jgi:nicotinamidase-related amidase